MHTPAYTYMHSAHHLQTSTDLPTPACTSIALYALAHTWTHLHAPCANLHRRVKKQKERLEQLNQKIETEKAELQRQLEEAQKHSSKLANEYNHARREAAHFAQEATLAKEQLSKKAEVTTVPEQLSMNTEKAQNVGVDGGTQASRPLFDEADDDLFDGTPEEVSKKLEQRIAFQKRTLTRLEQELKKFKNGDPSTRTERLGSSWAHRGRVLKVVACFHSLLSPLTLF